MEIQPVDPEFVRIWSRVKAPQAPASQVDAGQWEEVLLGALALEMQRLAAYRRWGLAAPGRRCLARVRRLKTACFFLLGPDRPLPSPAPQSWASRREAVRGLYLGEGRSGRDYGGWSQTAPAELGEVFLACQTLCRESCRLLWALAEEGRV